ncbi:hypothetical protein [Mycolicibacterium phlei]|jgi:hypothetical protein
MSTPISEPAALTKKFVDNANKMWVAAAEQSDSKDGLGIDGRIALVHGLVDLWVKAYISWLDLLIKSGPAWFPGTKPADKPLPSEPVTVAPRPYARTIECDGPLVRVGLPSVKVPPSAITFDPPFLPAGLTEFRVVLTDYRFIGSNYTGKFKLTNSSKGKIAPQDLVPEEKVVTVGL